MRLNATERINPSTAERETIERIDNAGLFLSGIIKKEIILKSITTIKTIGFMNGTCTVFYIS